jgi:hypothetical protein
MRNMSRKRRAAPNGRLRGVEGSRSWPRKRREDLAEHDVGPQTTADRICRVEGAILKALGKERGLLRQLEQLRSESEHTLHEAFFEAGYGHGIAEGQAEAFRSTRPAASPSARQLANEARSLAGPARLKTTEAVVMLLEATLILLGKP